LEWFEKNEFEESVQLDQDVQAIAKWLLP
jgi:hypothetical protein